MKSYLARLAARASLANTPIVSRAEAAPADPFTNVVSSEGVPAIPSSSSLERAEARARTEPLSEPPTPAMEKRASDLRPRAETRSIPPPERSIVTETKPSEVSPSPPEWSPSRPVAPRYDAGEIDRAAAGTETDQGRSIT